MSVTFRIDGRPENWDFNIGQAKYQAIADGTLINVINRDKDLGAIGRCTPVEFFRLLWNMGPLLKHELGDTHDQLLHLASTAIADDALFISWS